VVSNFRFPFNAVIFISGSAAVGFSKSTLLWSHVLCSSRKPKIISEISIRWAKIIIVIIIILLLLLLLLLLWLDLRRC
jgi:hypothetical protein